MKLNTKPISSPGRAEKYPPPLMRFLRSNVGSKSRGKSRSSPMFIRKRNTNSTNTNSSSGSAIETTQEPSSPKVTCMGQVRVKYSKNQPKKRNTKFQWKKWVKSSLCCCQFSKPKCSKPSCEKWVSFFKFRFKRRRKNGKGSEFSKSNEETEQVAAETEKEEESEDDNTSKEFVRNVIIPPKNALILTRSRSAPYRSSSLAYRFWGSPLINEEETEQKQSKTEDRHEEEEDNDSSTSKRELLCKESDKESSKLDEENEIKIEFLKESEMKTEEENEEEDERTTSTSATASITSVHPLILMRCKSEPARIAEKKFDPDSISFWKKRRFGFT